MAAQLPIRSVRPAVASAEHTDALTALFHALFPPRRDTPRADDIDWEDGEPHREGDREAQTTRSRGRG